MFHLGNRRVHRFEECSRTDAALYKVLSFGSAGRAAAHKRKRGRQKGPTAARPADKTLYSPGTPSLINPRLNAVKVTVLISINAGRPRDDPRTQPAVHVGSRFPVGHEHASVP